MSKVTKTFQFGEHEFKLETGEIARQADSAIIASCGDTVVMVTVVNKMGGEPRDFMPLTIDVEERTYAAGKIPGGFFRREGRPSEKAILTCRLIDRPLRPLFPKGFGFDVQVVITIVSIDPNIDTEIVSLVGASAALATSGIPFNGPVGAARVGYIDGEYLLNPSMSQLVESQLDLVVAGTSEAVLMVESEANILSEEVMLGAVMYGHKESQKAIKAIQELADEVAKPMKEWTPPVSDASLAAKVAELSKAALEEAFSTPSKVERVAKISQAHSKVLSELLSEDSSKVEVEGVNAAFKSLEKSIVRGRIIAGEKRIDGRDTTTVRPIQVRTGLWPRTHGSALFTRGETQAAVTATLGTERDAQRIDALEGDITDRFMLHYNFPPYSVGETGRVGSPKRREIGHGRLARRGVAAVLPTAEEFPYVIRVVSEITESNGSSSMASVCGTSLALMDAGVKIKAPVAGIAMGLIKEGDNFAVLTDILGDEDHLGDMDFKVAGTPEGITALQMDIKIDGITEEIMTQALAQAKDARVHILEEMAKVIDAPRAEMSEHAPRIITFKIHPDKIRDVIGKGGAVIRALCEETGATIDIEDDGTINVASVDGAQGAEARRRIEEITADIEVDRVYTGKVVKIMEFGAFVNVLPGKDGLVHISQISNERVEDVSDHLSEGDEVTVKVLEVDKQGRVRLSMKAVDQQALLFAQKDLNACQEQHAFFLTVFCYAHVRFRRVSVPNKLKYLLAFTLVVAALMYFSRPLIENYLAPKGSATPVSEQLALDYSSLDAWAAHPSKLSAALITPQDIQAVDQVATQADVFFVYPTTYFGPGGWNSDALADGFDKQGVEHVLATAASTFNACCAIYAPQYRQAHFAAFIPTDQQQGSDALDYAYEDVEDAFEAFLTQRDPSRPFFIASHSQGTLHSTRLLHNMVIGTELEEMLIAAYLIGYWLPPDTYTRVIPGFELCENADDISCTISFDTYDNTGPGRNNTFELPHWYPEGWEWRADKPGSCLNPLSWSQGQEYVDANANLGGVAWQGSFSLISLLMDNNQGYVYKTLGEPVAEVTSAQCGEYNMLWVDTQEGTGFDNPGKGEDKSLHPKDWNLFYMNIRQNISQRLLSYQAKRGASLQ